MRKTITMLIMLIVSVLGSASAAEPQYHRFYNPGFYNNNPSEAQGREALKALFSGNDTEASKYWNPAVPYAAMRDIYALHIKETFNMEKAPSDAEMYAMVDLSETIPAPAGFASQFETSGIAKGTMSQQYFNREPTPGGELLLAVRGVVWTSIRCGNPTREKFNPNIPAQMVPKPEEFDRPAPKKQIYQMACEGCQTDRNSDRNRSGNSTSVNITTTGTPNGNSGGSNNDALLMMMLMQNMNRQPVERQRANAWDVIGGVTGIANVGLNVADLLSNRNRNYSQRGYQSMPTYRGGYDSPVWDEQYPQQPEYRYPQERPRYNYPPRQPRDYDRGTWPDRRYDTDYQGGSGDYRNGGYGRYDNTNASGLGAGQYGDPYYNQRNNPLRDDGRGNATDTRTGRDYTYNPRYVW